MPRIRRPRPGPAAPRPGRRRRLVGRRPAVSPDAATNCGEGVSPAASAAASGSPPGNAAATARAVAGRAEGSVSRQRRITFSTIGSRSFTTDDGRLGVRSARACTSFAGDFRERPLAREHFIQHQAQRINVAAHGDFFSGQLFGRHVGRSAAAHFVAADVVGDSRQAKIGDHDLAAAVEHDVGRLQVAMQNALGVGRGQSGAKLARDVERFVRRQPADAPQQRSQVFAIDVLHGEKCLAVDFADVVHAANIGMGNPPRDPHFVAKAFEQAFVACGFVGQKFQATACPSVRSSAR